MLLEMNWCWEMGVGREMPLERLKTCQGWRSQDNPERAFIQRGVVLAEAFQHEFIFILGDQRRGRNF